MSISLLFKLNLEIFLMSIMLLSMLLPAIILEWIFLWVGAILLVVVTVVVDVNLVNTLVRVGINGLRSLVGLKEN